MNNPQSISRMLFEVVYILSFLCVAFLGDEHLLDIRKGSNAFLACIVVVCACIRICVKFQWKSRHDDDKGEEYSDEKKIMAN